MAVCPWAYSCGGGGTWCTSLSFLCPLFSPALLVVNAGLQFKMSVCPWAYSCGGGGTWCIFPSFLCPLFSPALLVVETGLQFKMSVSLWAYSCGVGGEGTWWGLDWLALGHLQGGLVHVGASHSLLLLGIGVSIPVGVGVGGLGGGLVWLNTSSQRRVKIYFWSFYAKNTGHM